MAIQLDYLTDVLSDQELCAAYWAQNESGEFVERVADLGARFELVGAQITAKVTESCTATLDDVACTICGSGLVVKNRAARTRLLASASPECEPCQVLGETSRRESAEALATRQCEALTLWFGAVALPCDADDVRRLALRRAVTLWGLIRVGSDDEFENIRPQTGWPVPLSPGGLFDLEILKELYDDGLARISPSSSPRAFTWDADEQPSRFYFDHVHWCLGTYAGPHELQTLKTALAEAVGNRRAWPARWHVELDTLWLDVATADCLQFAERQLIEYRLPFQAGPRLNSVLRENLERFSVGQLYNFIWRAAKDAAALYQRGAITRPHAANTVPGTVERNAERALANHQVVKPFRRDFSDPGSGLWDLMANVIHGFGDETICYVAGEDSTRSHHRRVVADVGELLSASLDDVRSGLAFSSITLDQLEELLDGALIATGDSSASALNRLSTALGFPSVSATAT